MHASSSISRINQALNLSTLDLATSKRQLKKEVARRKIVEGTLRKNELHSSRLLEHSRRLQDELRYLSRRILSAQEKERKRISRELHDVVALLLTGINVRLVTLKTEAATNAKGFRQNISRTQKLVEKAVDIVHRFSRELRPAVLDDLGLIPALHTYFKEISSETGIRVSLTAIAGLEELSSAKRTVLYRIAQEAMTTVIRHAKASRVDVSIQSVPDAVIMRIKDDGKSFEPGCVSHGKRGQRLGLLGMRERVEMVGGRLKVESVPGQGTTITAQIPSNAGMRHNKRLTQLAIGEKIRTKNNQFVLTFSAPSASAGRG